MYTLACRPWGLRACSGVGGLRCAPLASIGRDIPARACSGMGGLRGAPCGRLACAGPDGNPPEANAQVDVELGSMVLGLHVESPFVFFTKA